jgi:mono/diheme cytochrome c family protein
MKKTILSAIAIIAAALAVTSFTIPSGQVNNLPQDATAQVFPEDISKIFEVSCNDCHTDAASNAKAKMKLNFSKWADLSNAKKVSKLESINDEVKKGDMPPSKYVSKYPDNALGQEQKELIGKWVEEETTKLMGK